jgi:hypothetical protein
MPLPATTPQTSQDAAVVLRDASPKVTESQ